MIKLYSIVFCFLAVSSTGLDLSGKSRPAAIEFFKEEITINIRDTMADVSGIYYFRNDSGTSSTIRILFPFAVDENSEFPCAITLGSLHDGKLEPIPYSNSHNAIRYAISIQPQSVACWRMDYSQKIKSNHFRYILKSTKTWGKPLEMADYNVKMPRGILNVEIWPEPDSMTELDGKRVFWCHRENFMPVRDLEINWE